jgi:hypothetical protein
MIACKSRRKNERKGKTVVGVVSGEGAENGLQRTVKQSSR